MTTSTSCFLFGSILAGARCRICGIIISPKHDADDGFYAVHAVPTFLISVALAAQEEFFRTLGPLPSNLRTPSGISVPQLDRLDRCLLARPKCCDSQIFLCTIIEDEFLDRKLHKLHHHFPLLIFCSSRFYNCFGGGGRIHDQSQVRRQYVVTRHIQNHDARWYSVGI